jgi:hypothetical protein
VSTIADQSATAAALLMLAAAINLLLGVTLHVDHLLAALACSTISALALTVHVLTRSV